MKSFLKFVFLSVMLIVSVCLLPIAASAVDDLPRTVPASVAIETNGITLRYILDDNLETAAVVGCDAAGSASSWVAIEVPSDAV